MHKFLVLALLSAALFTGCHKSAAPQDAFEQKLQETAGGNATNCGRVQQQAPEVKKASDCALQAAQAKKPFYVGYEMPGLAVGVAGSSDGKLFTVQSETSQGQAKVTATPCPAELRLAQSGRVTCFPMGGMGMDMGGASPHGGMTMPPATGANPHGGMMMPPAGPPNPHAGSDMAAPAHGGSTQKKQ